MPTRITENLVSWASELDEGALRQALATSRLPVLAGPVALMADAHFGHGAGRRLGRKAAERELSVDSLRQAMAGKAWDEALARRPVDEHPSAYKDLRQVMADQADLVDVVHTLTEVVNLKGL